MSKSVLPGLRPPCTRDCEDRNAECHIHCEKYAEYLEKMERVRKARAEDWNYNQAKREAYYNIKKKSGAYRLNKKRMK